MPKGKKGFQPGNKLGFVQSSGRKIHNKPICVLPFADQVEALSEIKDLSSKLRQVFDDLIAANVKDQVLDDGF